MVDLILFIIAAVAASGLAFYAISLKIRLRRAVEAIMQLMSDIDMTIVELSEAKLEVQRLSSSSDDGFVKFLSESRAWAYDYIEYVQKEIQEIVFEFDSEQKILSETKSLQKSDLEYVLGKTKQHFDRLKAILPENNKE
jgi:hypothetical protein